jgi:hypothetical protein
VSSAIPLVQKHLKAVWAADWPALEKTVAAGAELTLIMGPTSTAELSVGGLYRHISQAWDFYPKRTELHEPTLGIVHASIELTNGGYYRKTVVGEFQAQGQQLVVIRLQDSLSRKVTT